MVNSGWLRDTNAIEIMNLYNNAISSIADDSFVGLARLKVLYLSTNRITAVNAAWFGDLHAVETMYLNNNYISYIADDSFVGLARLRRLYLHENQITMVNAAWFRETTAMEVIDLSNNDISSIADDSFAGLVNLHTLILSSNHLTTLPAGIFQGLMQGIYIDFELNNWQCDCRIKWLQTLLKISYISTTIYGLEKRFICSTPAEEELLDVWLFGCPQMSSTMASLESPGPLYISDELSAMTEFISHLNTATASLTNTPITTPDTMETLSLFIPISIGVTGLLIIIIAVLVIRMLKLKVEIKRCDANNAAIRGYHDFLPTKPDVELTQATGIQEGDYTYSDYNTIHEVGATIPTHPQPGTISMVDIHSSEGRPAESQVGHKYETRIKHGSEERRTSADVTESISGYHEFIPTQPVDDNKAISEYETPIIHSSQEIRTSPDVTEAISGYHEFIPTKPVDENKVICDEYETPIIHSSEERRTSPDVTEAIHEFIPTKPVDENKVISDEYETPIIHSSEEIRTSPDVTEAISGYHEFIPTQPEENLSQASDM